MKLKELNLKNFGKFHNQTIRLGEGLNLISGENESGKSTVHTFIRSMLFGHEAAERPGVAQRRLQPLRALGRIRLLCGRGAV